MKFELAQMVQRGHIFALVDEVDSILIDEARTPLIISGPSEGDVDIYYRCDRIIPKLVRGEEIKDKYGNKTTTGDYLVDEKAHTAALTEEGVTQVRAAPRRREPLRPDRTSTSSTPASRRSGPTPSTSATSNYVVKDGQVIIVDEFTGRLMPGRRWSDGLHQAVEAKEGVKIERENQTLATITLQNYFRMYDKLAGMTGTADTEAAEFDKIYKLDVVVIPTNRDMVRKDEHDVIYRTEREKFDAVVEEIVELYEKKQPVLVGTISIEKSEHLGQLLKKRGVPHVVLNAKYHEQEATIVAQAGQPGRVTIATNMAGRGTDILLGGNPEFLAKQRSKGKTPEEYDEAPRGGEGRVRRGARGGRRRRRPPHHRHRAPRVAPHRQPAPRPRRPPGRPGLLPLLPLPRGRPDADLRVRPPLGAHEAARDGGGGPDRAPLGDELDRARPEAGRGAGTSTPASTSSSTTTS